MKKIIKYADDRNKVWDTGERNALLNLLSKFNAQVYKDKYGKLHETLHGCMLDDTVFDLMWRCKPC